jgi:outer membrane protein insertion porin family
MPADGVARARAVRVSLRIAGRVLAGSLALGAPWGALSRALADDLPRAVAAGEPAPAAGAPVAPSALPGGPAPALSVALDEGSSPEELHDVPGDAGMALTYQLESVRFEGNRRTRTALIRPFVPVRQGSTFDVADPELEAFRYRLLGTGWFDRVDLRLERGKRPGWVVLVVHVDERETLAFQQFALGLGWSVAREGERAGVSRSRIPEPYLGVMVADSNFLGTGKTLGSELLVARDQQGFALSYADPVIRASRWGLRTRATFVNGQEYFGGDNEVLSNTSCVRSEGSSEVVPNCDAFSAVVDYWRAGLVLGAARDIGSYTRLVLEWAGDFVRVPPWGLPVAASEVRGRTDDAESRRPIDFAIARGSSVVSMLRIGLVFDKRDSAILPTRGSFVSLQGSVASRVLGSSYDFVRFESTAHRWFPMRWGHTVRVGGFLGAVQGDAPFFYKFFVSDLTDLQPSRILGLNLDHRPAPNLFGVLACGHPLSNRCGTAIAQMRQEELAARIDAEYSWPIVRGRHRFLKNADAYALLGLYALADPHDLKVAVPGYHGLARLPIDLTFDVGVRLDTQMGVFQIGAAKLAWLPFQ